MRCSSPSARRWTGSPNSASSGFADLGEAKVERKGKVGHVTLTNPKFLNAEDDRATAALETAVDLVLLDDAIEVGVLRGGTVQHPKYAGRRIFNAGINLTHLYYGQISFVHFFIERELGLLHKIYRGHWRSESYDEQFEDYVEKPWVAAVEAFAIGGGCQLLCVMDRVLAEQGAYFNLPASKEGFIPGAANLRLPRLVGIKLAREGIFFERVFHADTPEGRMICDEVVPAGEMDAAIERERRATGPRRNDERGQQPQGAARRAKSRCRYFAAIWRPMRGSRARASTITSSSKIWNTAGTPARRRM